MESSLTSSSFLTFLNGCLGLFFIYDSIFSMFLNIWSNKSFLLIDSLYISFSSDRSLSSSLIHYYSSKFSLS